MNLKQKTVSGITWSFIDNFANITIQFLVGIILARILTPREFGLVGMLTIFIAISQSFIVSGFSQALIRENDVTQKAYSTVFYFNLAIGIVCFLLFYACAGAISRFFNEAQLKPLVQVLGITLIFYALSLIQRTILTKRVDFKLQAKISIISAVGSGIVSIFMAYWGYGVWSLVIKSITYAILSTTCLWLWNSWRPSVLFSISSFKKLFSFGSKLLISSIIDTAFRNAYYLVIGKYFSATELGFYTRADQFQSLPSQGLTGVIERVSYPVLSSIREEDEKLKSAFQKLIKSSMLISFTLMLGMAAIAKPMVVTLIGEKWLPSVIYLQLLCLTGIFYPIHALNLNLLNVKGRSDLFLRLEIIKKIIALPTIIIGIFWGIKIMIIGFIISNIISYYLNSFWSKKLIGYATIEQIKDILPSFFLAVFVSLIVFMEGFFINSFPSILLMILQIMTGAILTIGICELIKLNSYVFIKEIFKTNFINTVRGI